MKKIKNIKELLEKVAIYSESMNGINISEAFDIIRELLLKAEDDGAIILKDTNYIDKIFLGE